MMFIDLAFHACRPTQKEAIVTLFKQQIKVVSCLDLQ